MSGSFQKLYSVLELFKTLDSCTDSKGNESRNIYDLNFRITNLYRGHRVIKIKEIFICFRLFLEKYENLMLSYVLKKGFLSTFGFYI